MYSNTRKASSDFPIRDRISNSCTFKINGDLETCKTMLSAAKKIIDLQINTLDEGEAIDRYEILQDLIEKSTSLIWDIDRKIHEHDGLKMF